MAKRPVGLVGLAYCHFSSYLVDGRQVWKWSRFFWFGMLPIIIGILLFWKFGQPEKESLTIIVAVLSVLAAVLLGLLPLAQSIVGQANIDRKYNVGERPLAQQELNRIQTLQDLHASISWAVVLLVIALGCCAIIAFLSNLSLQKSWILIPALIVLYSIISSTAFTFFDVACDVFEGMESHSEAIKEKIRNNIKTTSDDKESY